MAATPATLKAELTAFTSVADGTVQKWLDRAAKMMSSDRWGDLYDDGQTFLAAHLMACAGLVAGVGAAAGAVKSKTVGPISITYEQAAASIADADLERTTYGRTYKTMRSTLVIGPMAL